MGVFEDQKQKWRNESYSEYCSDEYGPKGGCFQRMLRRDEWKLIYYHGQRPQLFNLSDDPQEAADRWRDPACRRIVHELTEQVLDGWKPEAIQKKMNAMREDRRILSLWAKNTDPLEQYRWELKPEMNRIHRHTERIDT